jgi:hypothetical protein
VPVQSFDRGFGALHPASLADAPSKFTTWLEFEVAAVIDITDNVAVSAAGVEFRESI